jgi:UDP-N-acetylmuramate dehydrogenase
MDFEIKLIDIFGKDNVRLHESMAEHTSFRIGGPADYYVTPQDPESLARGIALCAEEKVPYYIVGNGTNLLIADKGFRGVIFQILRSMDSITCREEDGVLLVFAQAGTLLSRAARTVAEKGYSGFEFAVGIPGTIGGAVMMNAGAYGGEIGDHLLYVDVLDEKGQTLRLTLPELDFGYRRSIVMDRGYIVLGVCMSFEKGDPDAVMQRVEELSGKRRSSQPLEYPSAGSTFKRPEGYFAGKLIQDCGLKGLTVGGAQVSEKHAGFVINIGGATAADVRELIRQVQERVKDQFGVLMEPEIRMIGEFE